jgi:hypothetical protein
MLILDNVNRKIEIVLAGAITTNQLPFTASYVDITPTSFLPATNDGASNSTTAVDMVVAPAASTQRQLKFVNIYNADTVAATVTVRLNDNGTTRILVKTALNPGYTLQFVDSVGWAIIPSGSSGIAGTTTNDNAAAGNVGEYIESIVSFASAVSLVTNTAKTVTSIALSAGDWDIFGIGGFSPAASTSISQLTSGSSDVTNAFNRSDGYYGLNMAAFVPGAVEMLFVIPTRRYSLAVPVTIYLVHRAIFTVSTCSGYGRISARRMR